MEQEPKSGFFRDDGTEINPDLIVKPSLCVSCLAAFPSNPDLWAGELQRRFPGYRPGGILQEWRTSLELILRVTQDRSVCSWHVEEISDREAT